MQKRRNSNRPYETVEPLAKSLGMAAVMDERTSTTGGVFDNTFLEDEHKVEAPALVTTSCEETPTVLHAAILCCPTILNTPLLRAGTQARSRGSRQG